MQKTLYRDLALVDAARRALSPGHSILVDDGRISWVRPRDSEEEPGGEFELVDAGGTTAIAGMVDAHSHLTLPGGSHWLDRVLDDTESLWRVAEHNATLLRQAGVRWARDVGAPVREGRAVSLAIRDSWQGRPGYPHIRAAGTWLTSKGTMPDGYAVGVADGDELVRAAEGQLDQGADLIKLYMDGPDRETAPFNTSEVTKLVAAVAARGAKVTAHSGNLAGAKVAATAGVAAIEHGFQLDAEVVGLMVANGVRLVSTLAVLESWRGFATTTDQSRFSAPEGRGAVASRREWAHYSVRIAHQAGVPIAAGTDFGGGSLRANQLAWEVECLVAAGLDPFDAIRAVTANGGDLLGEPDAGHLREGGPADFLLVHGDPLTDPAAMWRVWRVSW
jgi:imidazolonepropionase-like amidohydrolase